MSIHVEDNHIEIIVAASDWNYSHHINSKSEFIEFMNEMISAGEKVWGYNYKSNSQDYTNYLYNEKVPYSKMNAARGVFKDQLCAIISIPAGPRDYFTVMPVRADIDLGNGPGRRFDIPHKQFNNEFKLTRLRT